MQRKIINRQGQPPWVVVVSLAVSLSNLKLLQRCYSVNRERDSRVSSLALRALSLPYVGAVCTVDKSAAGTLDYIYVLAIVCSFDRRLRRPKILLLVGIYKSCSGCSLILTFCHFGYPKNFILLASRRGRQLYCQQPTLPSLCTTLQLAKFFYIFHIFKAVSAN